MRTKSKIPITTLEEIFKPYPFVEICKDDGSLSIEFYIPKCKATNNDLREVLAIIISHPELAGKYDDFDFWLESGIYCTDGAHFTFEQL